MKTVMSKSVKNMWIRKHFGPNMELEIVGTIGVGHERMTLYRSRTGREVIETSGDPVWDSYEEFAAVRGKIVGIDEM